MRPTPTLLTSLLVLALLPTATAAQAAPECGGPDLEDDTACFVDAAIAPLTYTCYTIGPVQYLLCVVDSEVDNAVWYAGAVCDRYPPCS